MNGHNDTKAWYIVQVMEDNQSEWWNLSTPKPVNVESSLNEELAFMWEQKNKHPESRYRLAIHHETVIMEAV